MQIKDVLVCLDASEVSEHRLRLAAGLAREHGAHLAAAYLLSNLGRRTARYTDPGALGSASSRRP